MTSTQRQRPSCTCKRPLKMSKSLRCGYCGGRLRTPGVPAVHDADIPRPPADIYDPTRHPDIDELPAQTTNMTAKQFEEWVTSPGKIFIIYLPGQRSFVMKVTDEHHDFFVAMVKQLRMALGPEVQAAAAVACEAPPPPGLYTAPPLVAKLPPVEYKPDPPSPLQNTTGGYRLKFNSCPGSGQPPTPGTDQVIPKVGRRGKCQQCGADYQVTGLGNIRLHHVGNRDE
jgi:hypothetical protein